jgi:hypothetical protein
VHFGKLHVVVFGVRFLYVQLAAADLSAGCPGVVNGGACPRVKERNIAKTVSFLARGQAPPLTECVNIAINEF